MNLQVNMRDNSSSVATFPVEQLQLLSDFDDSVTGWLPDDTQLTCWVLAALSYSLPVHLREEQVELSVACVSMDAMQSLNGEYRAADRPTNVLSFPAEMPLLHGSEPDQSGLVILGDVIVCPDVLVSEAAEQGKPLENHWAHMIIHSVLHLNGLDHQDEYSAHAMESLEIRILSTLDINNPYLAESAKQP